MAQKLYASVFVVFFVYMAMYLIRNNFKAAQPLLKEEIGLTTLELGYIGLAFSITYGLGKTILGYFVDGRNTKRIISFLLILSAITVLIMGFVLSYFGSVMGLLIVLWGLTVYFNLWVGLQVTQRFQGGRLEQSAVVI